MRISKKAAMALIMPWRMAAIPLTIAMRHEPMARRRLSICEIY
jgi:hypothetical protein